MDTFHATMVAEGVYGAEANEQVAAWATLIKSGVVWSLQGTFGRTAANLIEKGVIDGDGNVDWDGIGLEPFVEQAEEQAVQRGYNRARVTRLLDAGLRNGAPLYEIEVTTGNGDRLALRRVWGGYQAELDRLVVLHSIGTADVLGSTEFYNVD